MGVRLRWSPRVMGDSQKVYRSTAPLKSDALPAPLAVLGATVSKYDDATALAGILYYYAVSVVSGAREVLSDMVTVTISQDGGAPINDGVVYAVTIPARTVASNLIGFPLMVDLADMPASFWANVQDDGGNIRAYAADGVTPLPHDITYISAPLTKGRMFVKANLATASATTVQIVCLSGASSVLPVDDANGRNAMWSDFEGVWVFPDTANRSGKPYAQDMSSFLAHNASTEPDHVDWIKADHTRPYFDWPRSQVWTASASVYWTVTGGDVQQQFLDVVNANHSGTSMGLLYDNGPDVIGIWSRNDRWLHSTVNPEGYSTHRVAFGSDNTAERKVIVDGVAWKDAGVAVQPDGTGTDARLYINATEGEGYYQYVWVRNAYMSDAWMAADALNMNNPGAFYSIAEA